MEKKKRITVLTDITIDYLRLYYSTTYYYSSRNNKGYLFEGNQYADYINSESITNYFTALKSRYVLDENILIKRHACRILKALGTETLYLVKKSY